MLESPRDPQYHQHDVPNEESLCESARLHAYVREGKRYTGCMARHAEYERMEQLASREDR